MKKILPFFLSISFVFALKAQTKVLFLGNSFTYTYNIPSLFNGLATSAGISVFIDQNTQAGMAVADEQIIGHVNDATSQAKIASQQWDYIVVQDNMGDYANNVGVIPSYCGNANVALYNQIMANNSCTRIIYFAGWGPAGGVFTGDNTQACINRIHGNMMYLNNNIGQEIVSPIGKSWITSLSQLPNVNLYYSDNVHPSLEGSFLAAATLFTTIFKKDPTNLNYTGGVNGTTAQTMRGIAYSTITNSTNLTATNLSAYTPTINVSGNILTVNGTYSSYQWYRSGIVVGGNTSSYTAISSGNYQVRITNSNGCYVRSFEIYVNVTTTNVEDNTSVSPDFTFITVSKNVFELVSEISGTVFVYDMQGKLISSFAKETENAVLDLSNSSKGVYLILLTSANTNLYKKIMID